MFSSGPSYNKLKTNLRLCVNRLKVRKVANFEDFNIIIRGVNFSFTPSN